MSILLIASFGVLTFFLISQFGGKLTARNSLVWWLIFLFLGWGVVSPNSLEPVAHLLGIQLVSNFVLATMILFLAFQAIQESAFTTKQSRKLRDLITSLAAETFANKVGQASVHLQHTLMEESGVKNFPANKTKVVVGMPCYNEEEYLPTLSEDIRKFLSSHANGDFEYIFCVVNDGSMDHTRFLLEEQLSQSSTNHLSNVGVAGAMLTAFKSAALLGADYVIQCDSDGQHPLQAIPKLVAEAKKSGADLLIGSRYIKNSRAPRSQNEAIAKDESSTVTRRLASNLIVLTLKILFGKSEVSDPTSGFRVYSKKAQRELLQSMPDEYPEPETIALLLGKKMSVKEIFVKMSARQGGVSSLNGIAGARFMIKVLSALIGLRLRTLVSPG